MREKILALLLAKFAGVRKDGLAQLAASMALTVTTEDEANTVVGAITADGINAFVTDWRKEVDAENSRATKTYEEGLRKKFDFVEKKEPNPNPVPTPDDAPAWAKSIIESNRAMAARIENFEKAKTVEQLAGVARTKLKEKGIPESFVGTISIESEDKIDEFITANETRYTAFKQEQINSGNWVDKPASGGSGGAEKTVEEYAKIMDGSTDKKVGVADLGLGSKE